MSSGGMNQVMSSGVINNALATGMMNGMNGMSRTVANPTITQ